MVERRVSPKVCKRNASSLLIQKMKVKTRMTQTVVLEREVADPLLLTSNKLDFPPKSRFSMTYIN